MQVRDIGTVARCVAATAWLCGCGSAHRTAPSGTDAAVASAPDPGLAALVDWDGLPVLTPVRAFQSSSRDRSESLEFGGVQAGNKDYNNFLAICGERPQLFQGKADATSCEPGLEGYLIASADDGPGLVSRLYLAAGAFDSSAAVADLLANLTVGFVDERIRIYADDLTRPAYEGRLADLEAGTQAPFVPPLTVSQSGSLVSYLPIGYRKKLRILLDGLRPSNTLYYYQVDRRSSAEASVFSPAGLAAELPARVAHLETRAKGLDGSTRWADLQVSVGPGETATLLDQVGPGTVRRVQLTLEDGTPPALDELRLQASWDDATDPAIDVPLSALFACDGAPSTFDTLPMQVHVSGAQVELTLTLPMPFAQHGVLSLTNAGKTAHAAHVTIDGGLEVPVADFGTLRASSNERTKANLGSHYVVADLVGPGKYVGAALRFAGRADRGTLVPSPFNFLEGDDTATVDGELATQGTGTEESLDGGWYFGSGPFAAPFSAVASVGTDAAGTTGRVAAVRWNVTASALDFESSFQLTYEYGANSPSTAVDYASVALYYAK